MTVKDFRESGLTEAAGILEQLQQAEKEKLELTVEWQVLSQQEGESEGVDDFGATEHKRKELRKKCVDVREFQRMGCPSNYGLTNYSSLDCPRPKGSHDIVALIVMLVMYKLMVHQTWVINCSSRWSGNMKV